MADTKFMSFAEVTPSLSDSVLVANDTNGVRRAKLENIKEAIGATVAACGGIVAASLEWNGYVMFAGGFTIQWGIQEVTPNAVTEITFPVSFARDCVSFAGTPSNELRTKGIVEVEAAMITSWNAKAKIPVKVWTDAEKVWLVWIAVGF